jgi:hypothetical protein
MSDRKTEAGQECSAARVEAKTFGELHFGDADLGDVRRTKRLIRIADAIMRHPGGSLPEKMGSPGELEAMYHLMKCREVTHARMLAPHLALTRKKIAEHDGFVLAIHDTTELDFTTRESLADRGQIGNGSHQGWLCHNTLIVDPVQREVIGLGNQILHCRPITQKKETVAEKRNREDRESLLWIQGVQSLPADEEIVDVCDRAADTFEFLEHEVASGRTFVVRSSHDRSATLGDEMRDRKSMLHDLARSLPSLGQWTMKVAALKQKKTVRKTVDGKRKSQTVSVNRKSREAVVHVSASRVTLLAPRRRRGHHGQSPLPMWVVRVWEQHPPEGAEPLEWILLTNHPCLDFESAHRVKSWYECRWIIEEYHKGQKTGCGIEKPQFTSSDRLHPMIAILSVVALSLLNLRELSRRDDAKSRIAARLFCVEYIQVLSIWRHGTAKPNWTLYDFCLALARLGGHMNRKHDSHPGWLVLWKGWTKLQAMIDGARTQEATQKCA